MTGPSHLNYRSAFACVTTVNLVLLVAGRGNLNLPPPLAFFRPLQSSLQVSIITGQHCRETSARPWWRENVGPHCSDSRQESSEKNLRLWTHDWYHDRQQKCMLLRRIITEWRRSIASFSVYKVWNTWHMGLSWVCGTWSESCMALVRGQVSIILQPAYIKKRQANVVNTDKPVELNGVMIVLPNKEIPKTLLEGVLFLGVWGYVCWGE